MSTGTATPDAPPPMPTIKRFLFGGAGAIAPLIVLALSLDPTTVFVNFTIVVFIGYAVKAVLLFIVGGFVGFLQRKETDELRCFLTGISAPALITTYTAGGAHAQVAELNRILPTIRVQPVASAFQESLYSQFSRGFTSSNPQTTVAIVGKTDNDSAAKRDAAAISLYVDCSIQGKTTGQSQNRGIDEASLRQRGLSSDTLVVYPPNDKSFYVLLKLGPPIVAVDYLNVIRGPIDVSHYIVINQAQATDQMSKAIQTMDIGVLPDNLDRTLLAYVRPDCRWSGG